MDFSKIFHEQARLDELLGGQNSPRFSREKIILAILVELGELGNESQTFKYWKPAQSVNRAKFLEEYVDAIHFLSTIANDLKLAPQIEPLFAEGDVYSQLLAVFAAVVLLKYNYDRHQLYEAFAYYLGLGKMLNITNQEIVTAFAHKAQINRERFANNY